MLFRLISDLHLERYWGSPETKHDVLMEFILPPDDRDKDAILIIAGDFCELGYLSYFCDALQHIERRFKRVIYVPGNHEFWNILTPYTPQTIATTKYWLKEFFGIDFLVDESICVEPGLHVYGTPLWTNYNNLNPIVIEQCKKFGDFKITHIDDSGNAYKETPNTYAERFYFAAAELERFLDDNPDDTVVVASHFAPSLLSTSPRYPIDDSNYHFVSNLTSLMEKTPNLAYWCHGHLHDQFNYDVHHTRVLCNPHGRDDELMYHCYDLRFFEV